MPGVRRGVIRAYDEIHDNERTRRGDIHCYWSGEQQPSQHRVTGCIRAPTPSSHQPRRCQPSAVSCPPQCDLISRAPISTTLASLEVLFSTPSPYQSASPRLKCRAGSTCSTFPAHFFWTLLHSIVPTVSRLLPLLFRRPSLPCLPLLASPLSPPAPLYLTPSGPASSLPSSPASPLPESRLDLSLIHI